MTAFSYTALSANGKEIKGVLEADSAKQVRQQLRAKGLLPITVLTVSDEKKSIKNLMHETVRKVRISKADLTLITRQFATLLQAGMPLEEVLQAVGEQTDKQKVKSIILAVRSRVLEGHSLATGLNDFPQSFSPLYCATVASGEHSGHLDQVLERLADYTEKQQAMRSKIQQAMIYPTVMTFVSISIVIFLLIFVVPKMVNVFSTSNQQLPMMTRALIFISDSIQAYGLFAFLGIAFFTVIFHYLLKKNHELKRQFHRFLLKIPIIGTSIKKINTARFSRTLGILTNSGVSILEAMTTAANLVTNIPIHDALCVATTSVREGGHIHRSLKQTGYFPAMSIHLISSGEKSGQLEAMLERAANNQDQEVERLIETLLTLFEPLLILTMGAVVLFIVLAVLLPIFSLNQFTG